MRQVERNGNGGHPTWRKPLVSEITIETQADSPRPQFGMKLSHPSFQFTAFYPDSQIADTELQ